jgi:restriction system protein
MPSHDELFNPTLAALHHLGGSASIPELVEAVISELKPVREVIEQAHPGRSTQTELEYRLAWARTFLKKFGLIDNSMRAVWSLTPRGLETRTVDPREVVRAVQAQFAAERAVRQRPEAESEQPGDPEGTVEPSRLWRDTVLDRLLSMQPASFERLCMRMLRESGFTQVEVTGRSGDGGIDGYGVVRLHDLLSFRVSFQCKRWSDRHRSC